MLKPLIEKIDDNLNPVMLKELRQSANDKAFRPFLSILMIVFFITLYVFLFFPNRYDNFKAGQKLFSVFFYILAASVIVGIPSLISNRFFNEKKKKTTELMYTSTISPYSIILGKYLTGLILALQFLSACMPFMVVCYFMRGIDIFTILTHILILFIIFQPILMITIFFSTLPTSAIAFRALGGIAFVIMFFGLIPLIAATMKLSIINVQDIKFLLSLILTSIEITLFTFFFAIIPLSSKPSNRVMPFRVYLLSVFALNMILFYFLKIGDKNITNAFLGIFTFISTLGILISCSERNEYNLRMLKNIPGTLIKRILYFPLYTGAMNGMLFFSIMLIISLGLIYLINFNLISSAWWKTSYTQQIQSFIAFIELIFTASVISFIFKKKFLKNNLKMIPPTLLALFIMLISFAIPFVIMLLSLSITEYHAENIGKFFITTPMGCAINNDNNISVMINHIIGITGLFLFIPYLINAFKQFKNISTTPTENSETNDNKQIKVQ